MQTVPALPWPTGDGGGTIKLSRLVTEEDLLHSILSFELNKNGRPIIARIEKYLDDTIRIMGDEDVFIIDPILRPTNTLTLRRAGGEEAEEYSLVRVGFNDLHPDGIYVLETSPRYVFRLTAGNHAVPLYKTVSLENSQADWWMYSNGLTPTTGAYPLNQATKSNLANQLLKFNITNVDEEGEQREELTQQEVSIIW